MKKILFLFVVLSFISCKEKEEPSLLMHNQGEALGTTYSIQYESSEDFIEDFNLVFERVNQSMSTYLPTSDISRVNRGDTTVVVDSLFRNVFRASYEVWKETNGVFDPTVGSLVNAYGFGPKDQLKAIDSVKIDSIMKFVGFDKIALTENNTIQKKDPRVYLDFNAIAKGYTVDLLGDVLNKKGVENYLIELGGELLAKGKNPEKDRSWTVAIDDPTQDITERTIIRVLVLNDRAMASSGNYRHFKEDPITGQKYVHSINPLTGWPKMSNILSATVIAENCMLADAYATAFMVMDLEETIDFLKYSDTIDAYIVYTDEYGAMKEWMTTSFEKAMLD